MLSSEKSNQRVEKIRLFLLGTGVVLSLYYTIFDFVDRSSFENAPILMFCNFGLIAGVFFHFKGKKNLANIFYLIPAQIFMTFLIYKSGGIKAPGVFWFSMLPVIWGLLWSLKGIIFGYLSVLITFLYMFFLNEHIQLPQHFFVGDTLFNARLENLILFSTFVFVFLFFYTQILAKAHESVESKKQEVATLLKILVHDISTPLFIVNGLAGIIKESKEYDDSMMEKIGISLDKMNQIIVDVRRLFAISDGKLSLKKESVRLRHCVDDVLKTLSTNIQKKQVQVSVHEKQDSLICAIDPSIFTNQVLLNLLNNSIKFCHENGEIYIEIFSDEESNYIDIIDNGIGVPESLLPKLFDFEEDTSRDGTQGEKGTGFGLPIVKRIMEQLEGDIVIDSPPSKKFDNGTLVRIQLKKA